MVLSDDFYYQPIKLDTINTQVYTDLLAKEGDASGRGVRVTLTENGVVKNTTGITLNLKWEHTAIAGLQGVEPFEAVDLTKGIYKLKYPTNMLQRGTVKAFIQIIDNGGLAGSRNIKITVDSTVGDDAAIESSNDFTALVTALVKTNHMENLLNEAIAGVTVDSEVITARNSTAKQKTFTVLDERMEDLENDVYYPANNELTQADFDATTGWLVYQGTLAVAGNVASVTGTSGTYPNVYQDVNCEIGDKLYYAAQARVTTAGAVAIALRSEGVELTTDNGRVLAPEANVWYQLDTIKTAGETTPSFSVSQRYSLAADSTGKVLQVKKPIALNLSKIFGDNAIPTIEQIRAILSRFMDSHFIGNEGLSQPALLMGKALSLEAQFNAAIAGVTVDSETINARVGEDSTTHATLKARLDTEKSTIDNSLVSLGEQLEQTNVLSAEAVAKADAMASGSPKGVYATLALLQAAYPTGATGAYLVTADGKWYYWSGSAWAIGGTYQSAGIAERSVTREKVAKNLVSLEESVELSLSDFTYDNVTVGYTNSILTSAAELRYYHSCFLPENVYEVSFNPLLIANEVWVILGGDHTRFTSVQLTASGIKILTEIVNSGTLGTDYLLIESGTRYAATITAADVIKVSYFNDKYSFYINGVLVYTLNNALLTNPNAVGIKTNNRLGFILQKAYNDSAGAVKIVDVKTDTLLTDRVNSIDQALADLVGTPLKNTIVNFLGDSITEGPIYKGYTSYVDILSARTGITARNYGITSSRITYKSDRTDAFCTRYTNMDDNADVVIVFGGTNDHTDVPLGTWGDSTNDTLNGAIKILIEGLLTKYAGKAIGFVIPLPKIGNIGDTGTLKNYVDAIKYACKQYSVPVLDLYTQSGLAPNLAIQRTILMPDGLHPNYTGQELISYKIESFIKTLA